MKVRNGVCTTRTGFRCVVIDKDGKVKPIVETWQNGYASHRCTLQEYDRMAGDKCFRIEWGHGSDEAIKQVIFEGESDESFKVLPVTPEQLAELPDYVREFLKPAGRGESYLPL